MGKAGDIICKKRLCTPKAGPFSMFFFRQELAIGFDFCQFLSRPLQKPGNYDTINPYVQKNPAQRSTSYEV